jgi:hypothetical protein
MPIYGYYPVLQNILTLFSNLGGKNASGSTLPERKMSKLKDVEVAESMCNFTFLALTLSESENLQIPGSVVA